MKRIMGAALFAALTLVTVPTPAEAITAAQSCARNAFRQDAMAGTYWGTDRPIMATIFPCGGTYLQWRGTDGLDHEAIYAGFENLRGGGFIAEVMQEDPIAGTPWGTRTITLKPAEPGYIQAIFYLTQTREFQILRLVKAS